MHSYDDKSHTMVHNMRILVIIRVVVLPQALPEATIFNPFRVLTRN